LNFLSGTYKGDSLSAAGWYRLDLRIDVDARDDPISPVLNVLSGDVYYAGAAPGGQRRDRFSYSWIVSNPAVSRQSEGSASIGGLTDPIRAWAGPYEIDLVFVISISLRKLGDRYHAEVVIDSGNGFLTFGCWQVSPSFRDVTLELDVCESVNNEPVAPSYQTTENPVRPASLGDRLLTIEQSYRDAGIGLTLLPDRSIVDDSADPDNVWTPREIYDTAATYFSAFTGPWPAWHAWGLLASGSWSAALPHTEVDGVTIMSQENPRRVATLIFREASAFNALQPTATPAATRARRDYLFTWVHEIGHLFAEGHNFDTPSWMSYPSFMTEFWEQFEFAFTHAELRRIRHRELGFVIFGQSSASRGFTVFDDQFLLAIPEDSRGGIYLSAKPFYEFLEPVFVRIGAQRKDRAGGATIDPRLTPEFGLVRFFIRTPSGRVRSYRPLIQTCGRATADTEDAGKGAPGKHSSEHEVFLSFGRDGFYFDEPGNYLVWAVSGSEGGACSNVARVRIGAPDSVQADRFAADYFTRDVGICLYLRGSHDPRLSRGMDLLDQALDELPAGAAAARIAETLAPCYLAPYHRIVDGVRKRTNGPDVARGRTLIDRAASSYVDARLVDDAIRAMHMGADHLEHLGASDDSAALRAKAKGLRP
jgi:hypothetical protein